MTSTPVYIYKAFQYLGLTLVHKLEVLCAVEVSQDVLGEFHVLRSRIRQIPARH
jgi:hypothetical protein